MGQIKEEYEWSSHFMFYAISYFAYKRINHFNECYSNIAENCLYASVFGPSAKIS